MADSKPETFVELLAGDYKKEVLEELVDNPLYSFTINELAEKVSGSYNSVSNFLRELERFDIVGFTKKGGSYLVTYNQDSRYHQSIKDLLRADNKTLENAAREYAEKLFRDCNKEDAQIRSILLFGSVARGTAGPDSDIDILVVTEPDAEPDRVKEIARKYAQNEVEIENDIVPVVEDVEQFSKNYREGKRFERNVMKDGFGLKGENPYVED